MVGGSSGWNRIEEKASNEGRGVLDGKQWWKRSKGAASGGPYHPPLWGVETIPEGNENKPQKPPSKSRLTEFVNVLSSVHHASETSCVL